jgi:hypothetical protein
VIKNNLSRKTNAEKKLPIPSTPASKPHPEESYL